MSLEPARDEADRHERQHDRREAEPDDPREQRRGDEPRELARAQNLFALYFMALMMWLSGHATLESALVPILRDAIALQIRGFRP